jgi:hypothetical protein
MDITIYTNAIKETMKVVNSDTDSILKEAEGLVKAYLEENTRITDDERANIYAKFVTDVTTTAITQAITASAQLALEGAVNDQKVLSMQGELALAEAKNVSEILVDTQKITSMQNEDTARRNEVATKVAKAKIEVEQLIPSQININQKELEIKDKDLQIKDKSLEVETKRVDIMTQDIALKTKQVLTEDKKVALMGEQLNVEKEKVPLMKAQALLETKKVSLMEVQIETEREKVTLMEKQVLIEVAKLPLMEAQTANELERVKLTVEQTAVEASKVRLQKAEVELRYADVYYRQQQAQTVAQSLIVNERIENNKNETQLKIATIQASSI